MTGERELPEGDRSDTGGDEEEDDTIGAGGTETVRSGGAPGAKNPTCRTLGSITVRGDRRGSIGAWKRCLAGRKMSKENLPGSFSRKIFGGLSEKPGGLEFGLIRENIE